MTDWNLVSETLPPLNVPCFLYEPDRGMWIGGRGAVEYGAWLWGHSYATVWDRGPDGGWDGDIECDDDYQPTHWIPLPSPPNAQEHSPNDKVRADGSDIKYSTRRNNSGGPGWHVVNQDGNTVCWVYEQPWGGPDEKRAEAIAEMLNADFAEPRNEVRQEDSL